MKKFLSSLFMFLAVLLGITNVNAADDSITFYNTNMVGVNQIYDAGTTYKEVDTSAGRKIGYCFNKKMDAPPTGSKLVKTDNSILPNEKKTNQYIYILDNGYGGNWNTSIIGNGNYTNHQKYYITQVALWLVQGELDAKVIKNSGNLGTAAYNLYNAAVKNSSVSDYKPEIKLTGSTTMKKESNSYTSGDITLTVKGAEKAVVSVSGANAAIYINGQLKGNKVELKNGTKFVIKTNSTKLSKDVNINVKATASVSRKKIQIYKYNESDNYQNIGLIFNEKYSADDSLNFKIEAKGELIVSKVEVVDGKEKNLKGATLVLKDSKGKELAKWNTDSENPKKITGLTIGETYTISEVKAPNGYKVAADTKVTIKSSESVNIKVYNSKTTPIVISKKDITNEKELAGATLVVKDSFGKIIDKWVSTTTPHYITKELTPGTYYLSETIAPEGYALSTNTVEFKVNTDGKVDGTVVMYNKPKKGVTISKQDVATSKELPGATLVLKNSKGEIVEEWVSTTTPHYIDNLEEGTYTLIETKSPEGYGLSDEVITFEVKYDGKEMEPIVMYNSIIPDTSGLNIAFIVMGLFTSVSLGVFGFKKFMKRVN